MSDVRRVTATTLLRPTRCSRSPTCCCRSRVVILFSFNAPSGRFNYVWEGFTLDNWLNWDAVPGIRDA